MIVYFADTDGRCIARVTLDATTRDPADAAIYALGHLTDTDRANVRMIHVRTEEGTYRVR